MNYTKTRAHQRLAKDLKIITSEVENLREENVNLRYSVEELLKQNQELEATLEKTKTKRTKKTTKKATIKKVNDAGPQPGNQE